MVSLAVMGSTARDEMLFTSLGDGYRSQLSLSNILLLLSWDQGLI